MAKPSSRIPIELQAVFLASNRGEEVYTPPPGNVAFRLFQSIFQRSSGKPQTPTIPSRRGLRGRLTQLRQSNTKHSNDQANEITERRPSTSTYTHPVCTISFQYGSQTKICHEERNSSPCRTSSRQRDDNYSDTSSITFTIAKEAKKIPKKEKIDKNESPQAYLDAMAKRHGYSKKRHYAHKTGYYSKTTRTQRLSYHANIVELVKFGKVNQLRKLFATGISTNPANEHGEGLIHLVCRLGASDVLNVMIEAGCDVQVADDNGRTPMHDACSCTTKPSFEVVKQLLKIDPYLLFVMDVRGSLPLSYVKEKDYEEWMCFLKCHKNEFWPAQFKKDKQVPPLSLQLPFTRPVPEPRVVLPSAFVGMLASGRMSPEEVTMLHDFDESCDGFELDDDDDDDEDDDSDEDDSESDDFENGEEEEEEEEDDSFMQLPIVDVAPDKCSFGHIPCKEQQCSEQSRATGHAIGNEKLRSDVDRTSIVYQLSRRQ